MGVKRGTAPTRLRAEVHVKNAAERLVFKVTYVNLPGTAYRSLAETCTLAEMLVAVIAEWDADYPLSVDGFAELEDERPGCCAALLGAYHDTRSLEREGN